MLDLRDFYSLDFPWGGGCGNSSGLFSSWSTGAAEELCDRAAFIINADHHPDNTYFGDINWVVPDSPSSTF